jgi:hypothetical protein
VAASDAGAVEAALPEKDTPEVGTDTTDPSVLDEAGTTVLDPVKTPPGPKVIPLADDEAAADVTEALPDAEFEDTVGRMTIDGIVPVEATIGSKRFELDELAADATDETDDGATTVF